MQKLLSVLISGGLLTCAGLASADTCTYNVSGTANASTTLLIQIRTGAITYDTTDPIFIPNGSGAVTATDSILANWKQLITCIPDGFAQFQAVAPANHSLWISQNAGPYTELVTSLTFSGITVTKSGCAVPTLSAWGSIILAALTVAGGGAFLLRRGLVGTG